MSTEIINMTQQTKSNPHHEAERMWLIGCCINKYALGFRSSIKVYFLTYMISNTTHSWTTGFLRPLSSIQWLREPGFSSCSCFKALKPHHPGSSLTPGRESTNKRTEDHAGGCGPSPIRCVSLSLQLVDQNQLWPH